MKKLRYALEAILLYFFFYIFKVMPVETASNIGGWIGRTIGPHLAASRKALRNLQMALPELNEQQQKETIRDMWDNLGRVMAEYPHLENIVTNRTTIEGEAILQQAFSENKGIIFIGAHMGNWEINCAATLVHFGKEVDITYRAPNNPWSDALLLRARTLGGKLRAYPKSRSGGRDMMVAIKEGRYLGMLIDQKYNEGLAVPFFGQPAMTNPVFVQLCQKHECPLIIVRCERLDGVKFKLSAEGPLELFAEDGTALPTEDVITNANTYLEDWIREKPGQWLWLHRRWDSAELN